MHSLGKPLSFEVREASMRDNFSRIRHKCEMLLAKRVGNLSNDVDTLVHELEGLYNCVIR
jgi:hypothetical protein